MTINNKDNNIKKDNIRISNDSNELKKYQSRRNSDNQSLKSNKRRKSSSKITNSISNNNYDNNKNIKFLPKDYINCDKMELIIIISRMLTSIVSINDSRTSLDVKYLNSSSLTRFHSRSPPQISIYSYLVRLSHYSSLENCVLIATVYYIDLLTIKYPSFALNSLTVHRFLLTATTIASKALCDSFCSNNHYAKVGGVNIIELNLLEVEFLKWVNYRVIPRDFNYDSIYERERKSSTTSIESNSIDNNENLSLKFGIATAEKILTLYYEKMIGLVGNNNNNNNNTTTNNNNLIIGFNDELIYQLESNEDLVSSISSSSSSSDLEDDEIDEVEDNNNNNPKRESNQVRTKNMTINTNSPNSNNNNNKNKNKNIRFSNPNVISNSSPNFLYHTHSHSPQISTYSPV